MPLQDDYRVAISNFRGPLDLLLFLIRRAEVDVTDIPIAEITDQYIAFLSEIDDVDVELAGDFLVMAATLIELKSRVLRPVEKRENADGDESGRFEALDSDDPRFDLIQQLLAYQRYRMAAEDLAQRRDEFSRRFPSRPSRHADDAEPETVEIDIEDAHSFDLFEAYERIVSTIDFSRLGQHEVEYDDTPIELYEEDLVDRIARSPERRITLQEAFEGKQRGEVIGLFMATLELVKQWRVFVRQEELMGTIVLELNPDADDAEGSFEAGAEADSAEPGSNE